MNAILIAAAAGLLVTLLGTPVAIRLFRLWRWGQVIREDGPRGHMEKMGTPTMGGIVIIGATAVAYAVSRPVITTVTAAGLALLALMAGLGLVGAIDDYLKIRRRRSLGLNKTAKFLGQTAVAVGFGLVAVHFAHVHTELSFIRPSRVALGVAFYAWVVIMVTAASNAVNLTDGLDGLASGSGALVFAAYVIIAFWEFRHSCGLPLPGPACYGIGPAVAIDAAVVAAGALGATAGFLWWNAAPAKIFMGDTGALALGGLYAMVTTSVIVQVVAFRLFHRRVFRMAPIHHHFELVGWPEFTVIVRFWILAGLAVAFGLGLFYADFLARGGTA